MEVLLKMNPALEIWFGEADLTEWEEEDWEDRISWSSLL